jgi:hypothetical protein
MWLVALAIAALASSPTEIAIYPGFDKAEVAMSARAVLRAADRCVAAGKVYEDSGWAPTRSPHVATTEVDGRQLATLARTVEYRCPTRPVWRCLVVSVVDAATDEVGYASVQCFGSHTESYTSYLVTATRDLLRGEQEGRAGTPKDRGIRRWSFTFNTDDFPGTHLAASASTRRKDGLVVLPVHLARFDDYDTTDVDESSPVPAAEVEGLVRETLAWTCKRLGGCAPVTTAAR